MATYTTIDPSSGETLAEYSTMTDAEVDAAITRAESAYGRWGTASVSDRVDVLRRIARAHRSHAETLAQLVASEMGKPVAQGRGEVELAASTFDYYADHAEELLRDDELSTVVGGRAVVRMTPIGALLGVMPWNFPFYQVARFVAPNLLLGNTILLKHARAVTKTARTVAALYEEAGAPEGIYENLRISGSSVAKIIADPRVQGVSLTGSEEVGRSVAELAGRHLKRCVLELGGSDPFIVLPDADLEETLEGAERARFWNAGQVCNGAKRMIVHTDIWESFVSQLAARANNWVAGDPQDDSTLLGPMASVDGRAELVEQVEDALAKGATLHTGGQTPDGPGAFYPVTVISGVTPEMRAYHEELFGPVAVLYEAADADDAVRIANDSPFGLGGTIFTENAELAESIANRLETGMIGMNTIIRSQPALPFGGIKASGMGRELGRLGMEEFANKKILRYK